MTIYCDPRESVHLARLLRQTLRLGLGEMLPARALSDSNFLARGRPDVPKKERSGEEGWERPSKKEGALSFRVIARSPLRSINCLCIISSL